MVVYQRPARGLSTLTTELRKTDGNPARTYEFVTGYGTGGRSSHNADANGIAHAVDIFVGPGNLSEARGIELSEQLRAEGKRGTIPGHPDRLAYIIHRGQIAGDHTLWEWIPYTGADWHADHIHVSSVFDYLWGETVAGNPADYDSTAPWDLTPLTKPQSSTTTPIPEEGFLMALSDADQNEVLLNLRKVVAMASAEAGMDKGMNEKLDEVVGNLRKVYWNTAEATLLLKSAPPADLAAQIDAAGIAAEVRDELVKLLAGDK